MLRAMVHKRLHVLIAIASIILAAGFPLGVALATGPDQITVKAGEFFFSPNTITLTVGQPVQLTIVNEGKVDHDLKSDIPIASLTYQKADNPADEQKENAEQGILDVDYAAGTTAQVTFTPTKAGTYAFNCDVPGHTEAGMTGTFIVKAAATQQVASTQPQPTTLPQTGSPFGSHDLPLAAALSLLLGASGLTIRRLVRSAGRSS
jgi:LPXTG-motif cell wall-anchored protein